MLESLRFVQGAIAKKDLVPALTHFRIENGTVRGYNGALALCSPIPLDIACTPKAEPLVRAISNCDETVQMSLTPNGRLSIRSGAFRALIDCIEGETPHVEPEGEVVPIEDGAALLKALEVITPFIGDDASRPWSNGVLLRGQSAFATNNVTLVEYWIGMSFRRPLNLPRAAVKEMLRIKEVPTHAQITDTSITFHYQSNRWIRSQLYSTEWPDLTRILDKELFEPFELTQGLYDALRKVKPFADKTGRIYFTGEKVLTHLEEDQGAEHGVPGLKWHSVFNIEMLFCLEGVAQRIDFSQHPQPCPFQGERLRGAIIGMKG